MFTSEVCFLCVFQMAPDYDHLTLMEKVEVFEHAVNNTAGDDLAKLLWLKSPSSEVSDALSLHSTAEDDGVYLIFSASILTFQWFWGETSTVFSSSKDNIQIYNLTFFIFGKKQTLIIEVNTTAVFSLQNQFSGLCVLLSNH